MLSSRARQLSAPAHPESSDTISLDSGYAYPGIFPDLTSAAERALTIHRSESLQYGSPLGLLPLRQWISEYLRDDGVHLTQEQIAIVNGAKNGLDLLCRLLTEEGDAVVVTAPMYFTAIPILRSFGLSFVEIAQDEEGIDVAALAQALAERRERGLRPPRFIYDVPDFHNPTGLTTSRRRRIELLALANENDIPIVEDSPYRRLRFDGVSEPSLKALDRNDIVFALGTFSKLLAPGLRIGWIGGPKSMLERIARLKSDGGTSPIAQRIVLEFCRDGGLESHIAHARSVYASHRDFIVSALRRELPEVTFTAPHGGYYLWVRFPAGVNTEGLAARAYHEGVSVIPGTAFFAGDAAYANEETLPTRYLRLAYSRANQEEIEEGIGRLAAAYRSME